MNEKTYEKLELHKVLARAAEYASFSASRALIERLQPTSDLQEALRRQQETGEARGLLGEQPNITIGGARDVRPHVKNAERAITLNPAQLLEVKDTLISSGRLRKTLTAAAERYPLLNELGISLYDGKAVIAAINSAIGEDGLVLDSASPKLSGIRRDLRIAHDRLQSKLQSIVASGSNAPYLQEALVTMRGGRYVIPVKAEHKGRIKGIVHDQSSSGATVFVEPFATVEINNRIRELEIEEDQEVQRILSAITAQVAQDADRIVWTVEALADLDAAFARAKYANDTLASPPTLVDFDAARTPGSTIRLYRARHPLLDPAKVVPIDVEIEDDTFMLIITGPNTGGKTVTLKTVGLMVLMAQCGLHIPASHGSILTVFHKVFADIDEQQSIEQSLSTFSAHLNHIIQILQESDDQTLVLLDELGQGTDPAEGAALARAVLNDLRTRGVTALVATHYPELKLYAHSTPGVRNASVEFDVDTLSPTYRLIVGLPGRSNALAIASRLGLPEYIIHEARGYVGQDDLAADDLLEEIHQTREEIRQTQMRLLRAEADTNHVREELQQRLAVIDQEREQVLAQARADVDAEVAALYEEARELRKRLKTLSPTQKELFGEALAEAEAMEVDAASLNELVRTPRRRSRKPSLPKSASEPEIEVSRELSPGDRVYVRTLNAEGEIASLQDDGEAEVMVGSLRVRVRIDQLDFRGRAAQPSRDVTVRYGAGSRAESPGLELHLIGYTVDEALPMLEQYLDQAYMAGLPWARIVHGKGSGTLRKAVRDALRGHALVKEYHKAEENDGGDGVTVVRFTPLN